MAFQIDPPIYRFFPVIFFFFFLSLPLPGRDGGTRTMDIQTTAGEGLNKLLPALTIIKLYKIYDLYWQGPSRSRVPSPSLSSSLT